MTITFRKSAMTVDEALAEYKRSAGLRQSLAKIVRDSDSEDSADNQVELLRKIVEGAERFGDEASDKAKVARPYPNPVSLITVLSRKSGKDGKQLLSGKDGQELALLSLVVDKIPRPFFTTGVLGQFDKWFNKAIPNEVSPHLFVRKVQPHRPGSVDRCLKLKSVTVRIPVGNQYDAETNSVIPEKYVYKKINFESIVGKDVWLCVSTNGKSLFFASSKTFPMQKLVGLLKQDAWGSLLSSSPSYVQLHGKRPGKIKPRLAPTIKSMLDEGRKSMKRKVRKPSAKSKK